MPWRETIYNHMRDPDNPNNILLNELGDHLDLYSPGIPKYALDFRGSGGASTAVFKTEADATIALEKLTAAKSAREALTKKTT
ncbi:MAG: hypothetical protein WAV40_02560 [Microgenomates group bacterium]